MESGPHDDPMDSLSDVSPFQGSQDLSDAVLRIPSTVSTEHFTPVVTVTQGATSGGEITTQTELYMSQMQDLSPTDLVMPSQDPSIAKTSASLLISSETAEPLADPAQIEKLVSSEFMLVPPTKVLPMASSSQITTTTSHLTMTSSSSTSSELLTSTSSSPQLNTRVSYSTPALPTLPPLTGLVPTAMADASNQKPTLDSLVLPSDNPDSLALPTTSPNSLTLPSGNPDTLALPANPSNLLEEASRLIRKDCDADGGTAGGTAFTTCWDDAFEEGATSLSPMDDQEYPESFTEGWSVLFKKKFSPYFGYVNTLLEAEELVQTFEMCTESHFISIKRCNKTCFQINATKGRPFRYTPIVIRGNKVPLDSVPYYHGGQAMYCCHLGNKRKEPPKDRPLKNPNERAHSKKVGCEAQIVFRVVALFPEHKLKYNTEHHRLTTSQRLSSLFMEGGMDIPVEWRVYILLPKRSAHRNHELVRTLRLRDRPLDRRLIGRICQLVQMGLTNTHTIQKHVVHFAENVLTKEGLSWKSRKDICGSRQVWWYRKQVQDHMKTMTLETSKFQEMIREVDDIAYRHNYHGYIEETSSECELDDSPQGRWKRRTDKKNRQSYEKQLANLKSECFVELQQFVNNVQACTQVEVLARMLGDMRTFRQTFERESTSPWKEDGFVRKHDSSQSSLSNNIIQLFTVDSAQDINQLVQLHVADIEPNNA